MASFSFITFTVSSKPSQRSIEPNYYVFRTVNICYQDTDRQVPNVTLGIHMSAWLLLSWDGTKNFTFIWASHIVTSVFTARYTSPSQSSPSHWMQEEELYHTHPLAITRMPQHISGVLKGRSTRTQSVKVSSIFTPPIHSVERWIVGVGVIQKSRICTAPLGSLH